MGTVQECGDSIKPVNVIIINRFQLPNR